MPQKDVRKLLADLRKTPTPRPRLIDDPVEPAAPVKPEPRPRNRLWIMVLLVVFICAAGGIFSWIHQSEQDDVLSSQIQDRLSNAKQAEDQGRYDDAIRTYRSVLMDLDSNNAAAKIGIERVETRQRTEVDDLFRQADAFLERGEYDGAIAAYQRVLRADPNNERAKTAIDDACKAERAENPGGPFNDYVALVCNPNR